VLRTRRPPLYSVNARITCKRVSAKHGAKDGFAFSYGNMRFSGTHRTKTPWPIVLKIFTVDYVGETTKPAKDGYNRLARGGYPYRWNISIYTLPYLTYLTLPFFRYRSYRPDHWTDLHARCLKRRGLTQGRAFWGFHRWKIFSRGISLPKNFKGHFTCKSKKSNNFWQVER
jgi:hypothetical protein